MAHKKGSGSTRNGRDSNSKRLGVKCHGGSTVKAGSIIVRQRGTKFHPGNNVGIGSDDTLYSLIHGVVKFERYGKTRQKVSVYDNTDCEDNVSNKNPVKPQKEIPNEQLTKLHVRNMAVIQKSSKDGFKRLALHYGLLDTYLSIDPEVSNMEISEVDNRQDLSDEDLAKQYLQNVLGGQQPNFFKQSNVVTIQANDFKVVQKPRVSKLTGTISVKFCQFYRDIPLYGSVINVVFDNKDRQLILIDSVIADSIGIEPKPKIDQNSVLEIVCKETGSSEELDPIRHYYFYNNQWQLVFIVNDVFCTGKKNIPEVFDFVVDASTGDVIDRIPRTQ